MIVFKVFVYVAAGFGLSFIFAVFVGKVIAYGNRHSPQRLTVVWRDTDVVQCSFTGTVEPVGEWHIAVTDERGWTEMIDRRDIIEVS